MVDERTDKIAREAARLIQTGQASEIPAALHRAAELLGCQDAPLPGAGRVRKHAQAMAMQAMGSESYETVRSEMLQAAEHMMTALEHILPDVHTLLVGRAAEGHIDAGVTIHIRLYTREPLERIVAALETFGYAEPTYRTIETRFGRMNQARLDDDGFEIALTRCLPEHQTQSDLDLVTGRPISTSSLEDLRRFIEAR